MMRERFVAVLETSPVCFREFVKVAAEERKEMKPKRKISKLNFWSLVVIIGCLVISFFMFVRAWITAHPISN